MDLKYLDEFAVLAETGDYVTAASRLSISQPSLTKHMQTLEKQMDIALFDRSQRRMTLTAYGKLLEPYARKMTAQLNLFQNKIREAQIGLPGLPVYMTPLYLKNNDLIDMITGFRKKHSNSQLTFHVTSGGEIRHMIACGMCSCGFITEDYVQAEEQENPLMRIRLKKSRMVAVIPTGWELTKESSIAPNMLENTRLILFAQDGRHDQQVSSWFSQAGIDPVAIARCNRGSDILRMVVDGFGCSILIDDPSLRSLEAQGRISVREINPKMDVSYTFLYDPDRVTPLLREFIHYIQENLAL